MDGKCHYTNKVDIWAIGCIFYQIIFHEKPFYNDVAAHHYASEYHSSGKRLSIPAYSRVDPDENRKAFISELINAMLEVDPDKRPTAEDLNKRFKFGLASITAPERLSSVCLPYQEFVTTNRSNSRIATVTHDSSRRLQQLWKIENGVSQVLWQHEGKYYHERKIYPSFSPDGEYVGFDNGHFQIYLIHTTTLKECVVDPQASFRSLGTGFNIDLAADAILSFIVGPGGRRLGFVVRVQTKHGRHNHLLQHSVNESLSIDVVPCFTAAEMQPEMTYAANNPTLFVSFGTLELDEKGVRKGIRTLAVTNFNLSTGRRTIEPPYCFRKVRINKAVVGTVQDGGDEFVISDIIFDLQGRKRFGFWGSTERIAERRVSLVSSAGDVVQMFRAVPTDFHLMVSNGQVVFFNRREGTIQDCDGKCLHRIVDVVDVIGADGTAVAFNDGRLTFLSKTGIFRSVRTETVRDDT